LQIEFLLQFSFPAGLVLPRPSVYVLHDFLFSKRPQDGMDVILKKFAYFFSEHKKPNCARFTPPFPFTNVAGSRVPSIPEVSPGFPLTTTSPSNSPRKSAFLCFHINYCCESEKNAVTESSVSALSFPMGKVLVFHDVVLPFFSEIVRCTPQDQIIPLPQSSTSCVEP